MKAMTDFREYRIGLVPPDWVIWGAAAVAAGESARGFKVCGSAYPQRKVVLQATMATTGTTVTGYAWKALDTAPDVAYQEVLVRFVANIGTGNSFYLLVGAKDDGTALGIFMNTVFGIHRFVSIDTTGAPTDLGSTGFSPVNDGTVNYLRVGLKS